MGELGGTGKQPPVAARTLFLFWCHQDPGRRTPGPTCCVSNGSRLSSQAMEWSSRQDAVGLRAQPFAFPEVDTPGLHHCPRVTSQPLTVPHRLAWSKKSKSSAPCPREQAQRREGEGLLWTSEHSREENTKAGARRSVLLVFH